MSGPRLPAGGDDDASARVIVSVPDAELLEYLAPLPPGASAIIWDLRSAPPLPRIDIVVPPYMGDWIHRLPALARTGPKLVQSQMLGYDGVERWLPSGIPYANAVGVHESSTGELAVALILASLRNLDDYVRQAASGGPLMAVRGTSLADRRVLVLGVGGVGAAIARRLAPFEVDLVRVGRSGRTDESGEVHGLDDLPALLPTVDVVILAVPLDATTIGLVDRDFLASMRDGALLVNVARGPVVDTVALVEAAATGRISAALDVSDPEPLPTGHPLLDLHNVLVAPHVGGNSTARLSRVAALVRRQTALLLAGSPPVNVVLGGTAASNARASTRPR